ncbi:hypothetical protein [Brevibacillus sp. NRS-1366]|uniref:hypothetical protein n=1 Tax=Brevibacillus sp. NRS-1366 TaxID=3233899 RepID=UPI003D1C7FD2
MDKLDLILGKLEEIQKSHELFDIKLNTIEQKLDIIKEQTANNTEYQFDIKEIGIKVNDLETDIKLLKKAITN